MRISDPAITHQRTDPALCAMLGLKQPIIEELFDFTNPNFWFSMNTPREWQDLGTVRLYDGDEAETSPTIKVEVISCPTTGWRFTIDRPKSDDSSQREQLVVTTGSGNLQYYYPMAEAIAENCLSIKEVA